MQNLIFRAMSDGGIIIFTIIVYFLFFLFVILMQYDTIFVANNSHSILTIDDCQNIDCYDEFKALEKTVADNEKKTETQKKNTDLHSLTT